MRESVAIGDSYKASYLLPYLEPRINGGGYEPDDKVFRGPYQNIIALDPALAAHLMAEGA